MLIACIHYRGYSAVWTKTLKGLSKGKAWMEIPNFWFWVMLWAQIIRKWCGQHGFFCLNIWDTLLFRFIIWHYLTLKITCHSKYHYCLYRFHRPKIPRYPIQWSSIWWDNLSATRNWWYYGWVEHEIYYILTKIIFDFCIDFFIYILVVWYHSISRVSFRVGFPFAGPPRPFFGRQERHSGSHISSVPPLLKNFLEPAMFCHWAVLI